MSLESLGFILAFLVTISVFFLLLEYFFPAGNFVFLRPDWENDLLFFLGQALVWNYVTLTVLAGVFHSLSASLTLKSYTIGLPPSLTLVLTVLLSDLTIYWGHRLQHRIPWLWQFHKVHHTARKVDYLAAFREHPLDNIYTRGLETLPAILLGVDLTLIAGFITFRGLWAIFIHSDVSIRLGFLEYLVGSPHLHHWHHDIEKGNHVNFANLSPLMDILFGTFYSPAENSRNPGISQTHPHSYFGLLAEPFSFLVPGFIKRKNLPG